MYEREERTAARGGRHGKDSGVEGRNRWKFLARFVTSVTTDDRPKTSTSTERNAGERWKGGGGTRRIAATDRTMPY